MVTFGGFETVYELYRHGLGSVSRARAHNFAIERMIDRLASLYRNALDNAA